MKKRATPKRAAPTLPCPIKPTKPPQELPLPLSYKIREKKKATKKPKLNDAEKVVAQYKKIILKMLSQKQLGVYTKQDLIYDECRKLPIAKGLNKSSLICCALGELEREGRVEQHRGISDFYRLKEKDIPDGAVKFDVRYAQTDEETTPLCWIPVPDVQMVISRLTDTLPGSAASLSHALHMLIITALKKYIEEAEARCSKKAGTYGVTWTKTEGK